MKLPFDLRIFSTPSLSKPKLRQFTQHGQSGSLAANTLLLALWLWLFRPVFPYLAVIFTRQEFRTNQILLLGILVLLTLQFKRGSLQLSLDRSPQLNRPALMLVVGGAIMYVLAERFLDINTLSASLFGLATYGLFGLWLAPRRWRQGLPAALLIIGTLPFGDHIQTFIGYPVRLLTANIIRAGLTTFGIHSVGVDTILIFESGVSQVDLPCSGVKSLWTGGLFLLAATWINRRSINLRWLGIGLVFSGLLLAANLARVGILVGVGEVGGFGLLAEMLHVPLGVLGFVGACAAAVGLLGFEGHLQTSSRASRNPDKFSDLHINKEDEDRFRRIWLRPLITIFTLILSLSYTPQLQEAAAHTQQAWVFSEEIVTEPWTLSPGEVEWLSSGGALQGDRWRFQWGDYSGSLLFITSDSWRAHHRPERCFQVYGLAVEEAQTYLMQPDFSFRFLRLGAKRDKVAYSAVYWLQSPEQATDDYASRIWADLSPDRETWVLVTILFDEPYDPLSEDLLALYPALRQSVAQRLGGE